MPRVLVLFAHPAYEKSRLNRKLLEAIHDLEGITIHDLYEAYPDFQIDVASEQQRLVAHDVIVLQHPFYWYSVPAILKEYLDLVLEHGFAYGSTGRALDGKVMLNAITTGGPETAYQVGGATGSRCDNSWRRSIRRPTSAGWPTSRRSSCMARCAWMPTSAARRRSASNVP